MVVERQRRRRRVPRPRHRLRRDAAHRLGRAPVQRSGRLRRTSHEAGVHRRAVRSRTAWTTGAPASTPTSPSAPPASSRSGGWKLDFDLRTVDSAWNATVVQDGRHLRATSHSWAENIPAGGAAGFGVNVTGAGAVPASFSLDGVPCAKG
ncbi:cellulose binding domain-containing protein [Streptomyces zaomyceticus]|uniref:cellulose binding domain-containing protein n=1 Tax=Streptomyces zaomyceticus TaxID=68286 RepID=UPI002E0F1AA5